MWPCGRKVAGRDRSRASGFRPERTCPGGIGGPASGLHGNVRSGGPGGVTPGGASSYSAAVLTRIGAYPIEREVGRGGMGVVYLGRDTRFDRPVVIKVLPELFAHDLGRIGGGDSAPRIR